MTSDTITGPATADGAGRNTENENRGPATTVDTTPTPTPPATTGGPNGKTGKQPKDPRYLALRNFALSISIFNVLGYTLLGFEQPWLWPVAALATAYTIELSLETLAAWAFRRPAAYRGRGLRGVYEFLLPATITGLAVNMLLYANDRLWPVLFGVVAGVGGKWVLRATINGRSRHFMNPSNFGITVALLAFTNISIAPPYHFTENVAGALDWLIPLVIVSAGSMLNAQLTRKMPLIFAWVGGFVLQAVIRTLITDISLLGALAPITSTAFVLFTFYMVTDPGTSPFPRRAQVFFGGAVAAVYGVLTGLHIAYGLFFALTMVCLVRGGYWWVRSARERLSNRENPRAEVATP